MKVAFKILVACGLLTAGNYLTVTPVAVAQVTPVWKHCSPNQGAVGPFYIIPPGMSPGNSRFCSVMYLSAAEATTWACYRNGHGNGPWPQMTTSYYGFGPFFCP